MCSVHSHSRRRTFVSRALCFAENPIAPGSSIIVGTAITSESHQDLLSDLARIIAPTLPLYESSSNSGGLICSSAHLVVSGNSPSGQALGVGPHTDGNGGIATHTSVIVLSTLRSDVDEICAALADRKTDRWLLDHSHVVRFWTPKPTA